jgi:hypothetical protein
MSVTDGDVDIAHIVHHCDDGTIVEFTTRKPLGIGVDQSSETTRNKSLKIRIFLGRWDMSENF